MHYIKQLDSLRALAILLVIISHWTTIFDSNNLGIGGIGSIGVNIFFVISGFLITGILLNAKEKAENLNESKTLVYRRFVIRRALRIFPLYYLVVIGFYFVGKYSGTSIRTNFFYYLSYTINYRFYFMQKLDYVLSPLWSLAVEEQFYLFWPILILLIPNNRLNLLFILMIAIGIITRYLGLNNFFQPILTPACFDTLGGGAALAYMQYVNVFKKNRITIKILAITAAVLFMISFFYNVSFLIVFDRTFIASVTGFLILMCLRDNEQKRQNILSFPLFIWLGRISYGLYIYHYFIPWILSRVLKRFDIPVLSYLNIHLPLMLYTIVLIAVASVSFYFFEKPITNLKRYFSYY